MKITDSTAFVLVTYFAVTDNKHVMDVTCAIRGTPTTLQAARQARIKLRYNKLRPLKLIGIERIV